MAQKLKKLAATALATLAMTAAIPAGSAFAINEVSCGNGEFVRIRLHARLAASWDQCYANAGTIRVPDIYGANIWVTEIWTGNNRVQWDGDRRWQPDTPIDKWTLFTWPNNPGGVRLDSIRIL